MKRIGLLAYFMLLSSFLAAQGDILLNEKLSWYKVKEGPCFEAAVFSKDYHDLPVYHRLVPVSGPQKASVELINAVYEQAEKNFSLDQLAVLSNEIVPLASLRKAKNDFSLDVQLLPYRKTSTGVEPDPGICF